MPELFPRMMYHTDGTPFIVADQHAMDKALKQGYVVDPPLHAWYPHAVPVDEVPVEAAPVKAVKAAKPAKAKAAKGKKATASADVAPAGDLE